MKAVSRFAQQQNVASPAVHIECTSAIPVDCGLGDVATWTIGGMIGINNLLPDTKPVSRDWIIAEAAGMVDRPAQAVTAMLGGLTLTSGSGADLVYKRLDMPSVQVVLVVPRIEGYKAQLSKSKEKKIDLKDTLANISRVPLVVEALRNNDMRLLSSTLKDQVVTPSRKALITGYDQAVEAAQQAGAAGITLCGNGPAMLAFGATNHRTIETAMKDAFRQAGIEARTWVLYTDSQGIAISFRQ
jgi:homoserine kinase